jgi:glycosyltransferase involved in cell wall biosynthesis
MKILQVNWPGAPRFRGGDLSHMRNSAAALRAIGFTVAESFDAEPDATGYDLVHVFNVRTVQVTPGQMAHVKKQNKPIVLSPIYVNPSLALWALQVIPTIFRTAKTVRELAMRLEELRTHQLKARLPGDEVMTADGPNRSRPDYDPLQQAALRMADHLVPHSYLELHELQRTLRMPALPFTVIPFAVDPMTFLDPDPGPFVKKFGIKDFVLQVGRIENSKNQLLTAVALRDLKIPLVFIGGNLQRPYLEWCRQFGPKSLRVLPHLSPAELRSAYAAARVHVLPSWMETCGIVSLEAALANCNVVCSIAGFEMEYFREQAYYCDPADPASIRQAVSHAYENYPRDAERRLLLKQRILQEYSWPRVAEATARVYRQVAGK